MIVRTETSKCCASACAVSAPRASSKRTIAVNRLDRIIITLLYMTLDDRFIIYHRFWKATHGTAGISHNGQTSGAWHRGVPQ